MSYAVPRYQYPGNTLYLFRIFCASSTTTRYHLVAANGPYPLALRVKTTLAPQFLLDTTPNELTSFWTSRRPMNPPQ